jgi:glycosyltransferase involved in cell wall biosynthesis
MTLISLVTGTFNRCDSLAHMIESARREIPRGLTYEIVVVDGGSTDDTLAWCKRQPDIRLIEHGELRGAIKAFCDGARAAQGEYVLLANDDVIFKPCSILAALAHLERTSTCGAVAFADNRTSLVHGDGKQYRVEGMGATTADGQAVMVAYAQVGVFRKTLGDLAGWWGDTDPIMSQARTYGGDNYLSSRIWEMGYTVDPVPQAVVEDRIRRDGLRDSNASSGPRDSSLYYQRYPTVQLPAALVDAQPAERLRIMHLPVYESGYPGKRNREAGLTEALAEYGLAVEWDYLNENADLIELVRAWQPDLLITQIQGVGRITPYQLASMRNAVPGLVIVNWNGDIHEPGLLSPGVIDLLRYVDLQTTVNARVLEEYERQGILAAYWQIGFKDPVDPVPDVPAYEVLFAGNCYNVERDFLVRSLRALRIDGYRQPYLGIYGNCRGANGNSHYSFAMQRALYQSATITIGDTFPGGYAYVSNRVFQALSSGAFMLQQRSEGLEAFTGLKAGLHYAEWTDLADLEAKIAFWLRPEQADARHQIAQEGQRFVRANFSYPAQARKLFTDLLPMIAEARREPA